MAAVHGATVGRVQLDTTPPVTLFAGFPPGDVAAGVVSAFGSVWVANFGDAGTVDR